jgi:type VI secretion system protein ImpM
MIAVPIPRGFDMPPAWYGKLPGAGDFVSRHLPHALAGWWERWLQHGMAAMRQRGPGALERHSAVAPLWNFAMPAGAGARYVQLGCIAPSCDRVGRYYPIVAMLAIEAGDYSSALTARAGGFYRQLGTVLLDAVRHGRAPEQLESALSAVRLTYVDVPDTASPADAPAGWPGLAHYFDPHGATSFWWTHALNGAPLSTCSHTGTPDDELFIRLFGAQQNREP